MNVDGHIDVQGILGLRQGTRPGFADVAVQVLITGPEPAERYEQLRQAVNSHCPVQDIFTHPVPVTTTISAG